MRALFSKITGAIYNKVLDSNQDEPVNYPLVVHKIPDVIHRLRSEIILEMNCTQPGIVNSILDRFYHVAYGFPASEDNHHANYTGLIEHSMSVANRMLKEVNKLPLSEGKTGPRDLLVRRLYTLITGLCHDLGKIAEWRVDANKFTFSPYTDTLLGFSHHWSLSAKYTGMWYQNSPHLTGLLINRILAGDPERELKNKLKQLTIESAGKDVSISDIEKLINTEAGFNLCKSRYYETAEVTAMMEAIHHHHQPPLKPNSYLELLLEADAADVAEYNIKPEDVIQTGVDIRHPEDIEEENSVGNIDIIKFKKALINYIRQPSEPYWTGYYEEYLVLADPFASTQGSGRKNLVHFYGEDVSRIIAAIGEALISDRTETYMSEAAKNKGPQKKRVLIIDLKKLDPELELKDFGKTQFRLFREEETHATTETGNKENTEQELEDTEEEVEY